MAAGVADRGDVRGIHLPVAPLIEMLGRISPLVPGYSGLSGPLRGTARRQFERAKVNGYVTVYMADRFACALGMHATEIWPDFDRVGVFPDVEPVRRRRRGDRSLPHRRLRVA